MDIFYDLINQLRPPRNQKFKSILFDESSLNTGEWNETISASAFINSCHGTYINCELVALDPFEGLKSTSGIPCVVTLPDSQMGFDKNMWIGFKNAQVFSKEPRHLVVGNKGAIGWFPVMNQISLSLWTTRFPGAFRAGNNCLNGWTGETSSEPVRVLQSTLTLTLVMFGCNISMDHLLLVLSRWISRRLTSLPLSRLQCKISHGTIYAGPLQILPWPKALHVSRGQWEEKGLGWNQEMECVLLTESMQWNGHDPSWFGWNAQM